MNREMCYECYEVMNAERQSVARRGGAIRNTIHNTRAGLLLFALQVEIRFLGAAWKHRETQCRFVVISCRHELTGRGAPNNFLVQTIHQADGNRVLSGGGTFRTVLVEQGIVSVVVRPT